MILSTSFLDQDFIAIRQLIAAARPLALFMDFDGTLAPLRQFPETVRMDPEVRSTLEILASGEDVLIAIISGRSLNDLRTRVGIPGVVYAGEHGMEIHGRGLKFIEPSGLACRGTMRQLASDLRECFREVPGVFVEEKHLTIAVHYRLARHDDTAEIRDRVRAAVELAGGATKIRHGKMVWEVVPNTSWNKGAAADWIYRTCASHEGLPVYVGDDESDEEAFRSLTGWITIRIGEDNQTAAQYALSGPDELHQFLLWLTLSRDRR